MTNFVFDVDGTLTLSRQVINPEFAEWFLLFCQNNPVYVVTGSDYVKTFEQLGEKICNSLSGIYNCCGNVLYVKGEMKYRNDFELTVQHEDYFNSLLDHSLFPFKTGKHIEKRIGLVNFSIVGRNAGLEERECYTKYDNAISERKNLAKLIEIKFPELEATVAGETGIDIYPKGKDKSQIANDVQPFVFFGDKIITGGNDYTVAQYAKIYYNVMTWDETFEILKKEYAVDSIAAREFVKRAGL